MSRVTRPVRTGFGRHSLLVGLALLLVGSPATTEESRYSYDDLGRLIRVERPEGVVVTYTYDAVGNRLSRRIIHDLDFDDAADSLDNCLTTYNPGQANSDTDIAGDDCDCSPTDGTAFAVPVEVTDVDVEDIPGGYRFTWSDQVPTTGSGTVYDVFSGPVSALQPAGDFSAGSCYSDNQGLASLDYTGPWPAAGEAFYFMLRGQNTCPGGTGTYGTANRDTTAALSSSPCD